MTITKLESLTAEQLESIRRFIKVMKEENRHSYKLDELRIGKSPHHTYFIQEENKHVIGFADISQFEADELELALVMPKQADASELLFEVLEESQKRQVQKMLAILEQQDTAQQKVFQEAGFTYAFTELALELAADSIVEAKERDEFEMIPALLTDTQTILKFWQMDMDAADTFSEADILRTLLLKKAGEIVATIRVDRGAERISLYGFVVAEKMRNQGIGRFFLQQLLAELKQYQLPIYLEVAKENFSAKHLYESLGFKKIAEFLYCKKKL